jgi:small-conductance mechanosensitive channel
VFILAAIVACGPAAPGVAQPVSHAGEIPQSLSVEHQDTLDQLANLGRRHGPVGVEARKALEVFKRHLERENAFILPPLTLLPYLADGKVTPDMKWAIAMADRVKAEREQIFQEHTQITDAMNALATAARATHDAEALAFAQSAVTDSLNDSEIGEPMAIVIGDYLKLKLQPGQ